jgi:hypothetical protein
MRATHVALIFALTACVAVDADEPITTDAPVDTEEVLGFHCGGRDLDNRYEIGELDLTSLTFDP